MESSQKQQDILEDQKKQHKCCVGLSFYTQQLRLQRRDPICFGIQTSPSSSMSELPQDRPTSAEGPWAKHICLGCSMWQSEFNRAGQQHASQLPRCEGVEVLLVRETADASSDVPIAGSSRRDMADQTQQHQQHKLGQRVGADSNVDSKEPLWARMWIRAEKNLEQMQAQLNNNGLIKFKSAPESVDQLQERLLSTAGQNAGRLRAGAELFASNAYTMLLKPWMDRWSERWSEGSKDGRK